MKQPVIVSGAQKHGCLGLDAAMQVLIMAMLYMLYMPAHVSDAGAAIPFVDAGHAPCLGCLLPDYAIVVVLSCAG